MRWINYAKRRYYTAEINDDLFGGKALMQCWGGTGSRLGGMRKAWFPNEKQAEAALCDLARRRHQRGYHLELDVWAENAAWPNRHQSDIGPQNSDG